MTFLTSLVLNAVYYGITIGNIITNLVYPAYQAHLAYKNNKSERLWLLYFFLFGILSILEGTVLFPVKYV